MNQPEPTCANENQLFVTFIKLLIFIMSLFGVTRHLQSRSRAQQQSGSKRPMEDADSMDDVIKRAYYRDSEESNDGSSSGSSERIPGRFGFARMEISGIAPLEASATVTPVGSEARSLDDELDEFLDSVTLEQADSTMSVYHDAESERTLTNTALSDAIGENVFWSICHEQQNGRQSVYYSCHICNSILHSDKHLLEHFVLEHEMDLIVV